jgi:hypothetical protein
VGYNEVLLAPEQSNIDTLNNVRREAARYFSNKKKKHLLGTIDEL